MKSKWEFLIFFISFYSCLNSATLEVGPGKTYATPAQAALNAAPGDTVLIFPNTYTNSNFIANLHGNAEAYIYFIGTNSATVIFQGNSQAFHFSEVSYIQIQNISITGQTGNGINIDDGGTFDTPTHHIKILNCNFYNMGSQGNNDLLKISGVDHFSIQNCSFINGAAGGSGVDMVGCHYGEILKNSFENMGSNAIQAKGGTQFIHISQNYFKNCGQRTLNLGGSTGLQFFRPLDAPFEAADMDVYANVMIGSNASVAFVGCVRVHVYNNTIVNPTNWIVRILQETVDPSRFLPCGDNSFVNNIVWYGNISTHVNVGPNTTPTSFVFNNNLWYRHTNPSSSTPNLPVTETGQIAGTNPGFNDLENENFRLTDGSIAINSGTNVSVHNDSDGISRPVSNNFDRGAYEYLPAPQINLLEGNSVVCLSNPTTTYLATGTNIQTINWNITGGTYTYMNNSSNQIEVNWESSSGLWQISVDAYNIYHTQPSSVSMNVQLINSGQITKTGQIADWNNRSGWFPFALPQSCHHVIFPDNAGLPVIIIPAETEINIKSLYIGLNNYLTLSQGSSLTIIP